MRELDVSSMLVAGGGLEYKLVVVGAVRLAVFPLAGLAVAKVVAADVGKLADAVLVEARGGAREASSPVPAECIRAFGHVGLLRGVSARGLFWD